MLLFFFTLALAALAVGKSTKPKLSKSYAFQLFVNLTDMSQHHEYPIHGWTVNTLASVGILGSELVAVHDPHGVLEPLMWFLNKASGKSTNMITQGGDPRRTFSLAMNQFGANAGSLYTVFLQPGPNSTTMVDANQKPEAYILDDYWMACPEKVNDVGDTGFVIRYGAPQSNCTHVRLIPQCAPFWEPSVESTVPVDFNGTGSNDTEWTIYTHNQAVKTACYNNVTNITTWY